MIYKDFDYKKYGFVGHLVQPDDLGDERVVIVIMGGEKSLLPGVKIAERFVDYGINAMAVSLFDAEGLPASPNQVPLELIEKAVAYLKEAGFQRISTYGMSMGSIFAVLAAVYVKNIENVIMVSPTHVPFEGTDDTKKQMSGHSVATYNGKDIPFVPTDFVKYKPSKYYNDTFIPYKVMGMWKSFYESYQDKEREEKAMLPIEKTDARILLIAGEQDEAWPSAYSARRLDAYLTFEKYPKDHRVVIYPNVGHLTGMMPNKDRNKWLYRFLPIVGLMYKTLGAHKKECLKAFETAEHEIVEWIR